MCYMHSNERGGVRLDDTAIYCDMCKGRICIHTLFEHRHHFVNESFAKLN